MKAGEIKKGNVVEYNNGVYQIRDIERSSPQGRGGNVRFRFIMYSVPGGNKLDASFDADDSLSEVELLRRQATFSYKDGEAFVFLDDEDYTPYTLDPEALGDAVGYITDGLTGIYVQVVDEQPVAVQLPQHVALEVIDTPPELKGGTATSAPELKSWFPNTSAAASGFGSIPPLASLAGARIECLLTLVSIR